MPVERMWRTHDLKSSYDVVIIGAGVHGLAIAYYLGHRAEIDAYLRAGLSQYEREREAERRADPAFYRRFAGARQHQS